MSFVLPATLDPALAGVKQAEYAEPLQLDPTAVVRLPTGQTSSGEGSFTPFSERLLDRSERRARQE